MTGRNPDHKLFSLYPQILVEILLERTLSSFILPLLGITLNATLIDINESNLTYNWSSFHNPGI